MDTRPPKLLILPEGPSQQARICTLAHPRTNNPSRYLFDPENGIYEFTKVSAPKSACRSWLIGDRNRGAGPKVGLESSRESGLKKTLQVADGGASSDIARMEERPISEGYIIRDADILIATPIDYLFLILPCFTDSSTRSPSSRRMFLSADDHLERLSEKSKHLGHILSHASARLAMEGRLQAVCDIVVAGGEKRYRLCDERLVGELVSKAEDMVARGLPNTMEEKCVRGTLETPILGLKREGSSLSEANPSQPDTPPSESTAAKTIDSQTSTISSESTTSAASVATDITMPDEPNLPIIPSSLYRLLRLRTALNYIISSYVPPTLSKNLHALLSNPQSPIDFTPLDEHLAQIAKQRAEALASRSLGDFSRKRSMYEEDDAAETRAEKRRKKEEEEKRKKGGESRGIRDLKKVDTKGMKKMSDFFGKAAATKNK